MTRTRLAIATAATAATLLAAGGQARAYVRYRTDAGVPFVWPRTCLGIIVYPAALADMMPADQVIASATGAADAWSAGQVAGTALDIQVAATDGDLPAAVYDGQNSLMFRRNTWCDRTDASGTCSHEPAALALTTVFARKSTGEILDADIEVNAEFFAWADLDLGTPLSAVSNDLQNALTHEVGHFIGLDHPCLLPSGAPLADRPLDNLGNPAPDCAAASDAILESTMFPSSMPGDLSRRTLAPDDELAAREIYPASAGAPAVCAPPEPRRADPGGCALGGAAAPAAGIPAWLAAALVLSAALRRTRRQRS
jgi:hypothetical protein